jgi:hypothetical protein
MTDCVEGAWPSFPERPVPRKHGLSASDEIHGHAVDPIPACWGGGD